MSKDKEYVSLFVDFKYSTAKAVLVVLENGEDAWIPRFCILEELDRETTGLKGVEIHVEEGFAKKEGLVE